MEPKINYDIPFTLRQCKRCGKEFGPEGFTKTNSPFFVKGYTDICNECLVDYLRKYDFSWEAVDKLCQYLDVPFVPKEFERLHSEFGDNCFARYADFFKQSEYESLGWGDYFNEFKKLKEAGYLEDELPLIQDKHREELKKKWGFNYSDEELFYLEMLYQGLMTTQNISGALQMDQALKACKISLEIDSRIRGGEDVDKIMGSYDKLIKIADFTPKNVKNASDFDSIGELVKWLEKRGFKNSFYDGATKDIVDETMANIQAYNRRLYTNEAGIGEQIGERLEGLKNAEQLDSYDIFKPDEELDEYESEGYVNLTEDDVFKVDLEEDE